MNRVLTIVWWTFLVVSTTFLFASIALSRGETVSAMWLVLAAILILLIGYRYYSRFIAQRVLQLDPLAKTPAIIHNDGLDYVPTPRVVLFGHHFAAIAGAGPLVGPVLALQMGYLPGMLWILVGVLFAGAVQDFVILVISMRRDARSLGELISSELGRFPGIVALFSIFSIMVILLAVLALIVVKALANSPWSLFAVAATIPIGLLMGIYLRFIRRGRVIEISVIGFILLIASIFIGQKVALDPVLAPLFTLNGTQLAWGIMGYGFMASILPVWLLLAPRDYLSTFLKIGTIVALAIAILFVAPDVQMPAITRFIDGTGPVWSGALFPFLFITIACGAVSGFHALIASGTTPKMIESETDARAIGYGGMLMEAFVAIMALVAASCLDPGVYFAINSPPAIIGETVQSAAQTISHWGFVLTPEMLTETAQDIGEKTILSRTGGAPALAIGIAHIFTSFFANKTMLAFWYHFAILFEALFILTTVDAGTRVGRFMLQDLLGVFSPRIKKTESWVGNILSTSICVGLWGYFLYQGVVDPLGGINTLWPLFGISNQMLAGIALTFATVVLIKTQRVHYAWITGVPMLWLLVCTLTAAWQKVWDANPAIGFLAQAAKYQIAVESGSVLGPATSMQQMQQVIFNNRLDAGLALFFAVVVVGIFVWSVVHIVHLHKARKATA